MGRKVVLENHNALFGKSRKLSEIRSGPYIVTKVITGVDYQIVLNADATSSQDVHRNHLAEDFSRKIELPNLLSNDEMPFNDDKAEHFYNEHAKNRLAQSNKPVHSFAERQRLNDYLPIFADTYEPSRLDNNIKSPVNYNSCHSTPNLLASSPDSSIPQLSPHTPFTFQQESPVITSQSTTPGPFSRTSSINPKNFQSTSTVTTPRSKNAGISQNNLRKWYGMHFFKFSLIFHANYIFTSFSYNQKRNSKKLAIHFK